MFLLQQLIQTNSSTNGNRVDVIFRFKPGFVINPGRRNSMFNIMGGIVVSHIDNATGLTKTGSFIAYNGLNVLPGSFGGVMS